MAGERCPKCESNNAYYGTEGKDTVLRCTCGYLEFVVRVVGTSTIIKTQPKRKRVLPRPGSKLAKCMAQVLALQPKAVRTDYVAELLSVSTSEAASQLGVLAHKGLLERVLARRGLSGGSTWQVTTYALGLYKLG